MGLRVLRVSLFCLSLGLLLDAQEYVPIISGGAGLFGSTQGGVNVFQPVLAPVIAVPLGGRWLVETRADLREVISRDNGTTGPYQGHFFGTLEYLQLDFLVDSHMTITAGRFLTPFGIFNERLAPIWIDKFQDAPYVAAIGTGQGYCNGVMMRGPLISNSRYVLNYEAYLSALSTIENLRSERGTGGRVGLFVPRARLELGGSYRRTLQGTNTNSQGVDLSWEPYRMPLEMKGEWAHS